MEKIVVAHVAGADEVGDGAAIEIVGRPLQQQPECVVVPEAARLAGTEERRLVLGSLLADAMGAGLPFGVPLRVAVAPEAVKTQNF